MLAALPALAALGVLFAQQEPARQAPSPDPSPDLAAELAKVVDLSTATEREAGVARLLALCSDVQAWLDVCEGFGSFPELEPGPMRRAIELQVLDQIEQTDVNLYVPKGYDRKRPAPLLLWGHGSGGSGVRQYQLWQAVADRVGMLVLAPTDQQQLGYSKEPRERAATLAALRWARRIANVDENAIFVGGWSRGGHLAWDLALRHPDLFAGMLPCIGGPLIGLGATNNMRYLENIAHLPIRDLQGSDDDPRLLMNLRLAFQKLKKFRAKDAQLVEFPDRGHDADLSAVDWPSFFQARREPWPKQVVRVAADPGESRAAWLEITRFTRKVAVEAQLQVDARRWQRMNEEQKRVYQLDKLGDHTARLKVTRKGKGRFLADGRGIAKFSLLLAADHLGKDGKVEVRLKNKPIRKTVKPSAKVLLLDFVERIDRSRLPVARVDLP